MAADSKRFNLGDRVACFTAHGWLEGTVVQLDFDGDKDSGRVPYLVELDASGQEVLAPKDIPELIVAAGQQPAEPWHLKQARELRERGFEYAKEAKHKVLFDPSQLSRWFLPGFLRAIGAWRASGDVKMLKLNQLPGIKVETTGVISFQCLTLEFCNLLVEEILKYQAPSAPSGDLERHCGPGFPEILPPLRSIADAKAGGFPQRPPNSMNNYGLVLNGIGLKPVFSAMLQDYLQGIAARLFGPEDMRDSSLPAKDLGGENWGGDSLSAHHTFVVRYQPDEDQSLDMHVDECDVTFNFALTPADSFEGNDLVFCGMLGSVSHRKHLHSYKHQQGRCVMHLGKRRHGALPISSGRRMSLIMWCKSPLFRQSDEYLLRRFSAWQRHECAKVHK